MNSVTLTTNLVTFTGVLCLLVSTLAASTYVLDWYRNRQDEDVRKLLGAMTEKQQRGDEVTDADLEELMSGISVEQYTSSPEFQKMLVKKLLDTAAEQRRRVHLTSSQAEARLPAQHDYPARQQVR